MYIARPNLSIIYITFSVLLSGFLNASSCIPSKENEIDIENVLRYLIACYDHLTSFQNHVNVQDVFLSDNAFYLISRMAFTF